MVAACSDSGSPATTPVVTVPSTATTTIPATTTEQPTTGDDQPQDTFLYGDYYDLTRLRQNDHYATFSRLYARIFDWIRSREVRQVCCECTPASVKPLLEAYEERAEEIRRQTGARTVAVGMISDPVQAEEIIAGGRADLIAIGRMALWDPYWPHHAAKRLGAEVQRPRQYERANIFN